MAIELPKIPSPSAKIVLLCLLCLCVLVSNMFMANQQLQAKPKNLDHAVHHKNDHFSSTSSPSSSCLSFDNDMENLISTAKQVYITMPPKAAGSSLKKFTRECMSVDPYDNFINDPVDVREFFTNTFETPKVITSHLYHSDILTKMIPHLTRDSVLIYIHRDESDRLISAIKQVANGACTTERLNKITPGFKFNSTSNTCQVDEAYLVDEVIKKKAVEIDGQAYKFLTCDLYNVLEENRPNMLFLHYKQVNKLQSVLAKYHCPHMLEKSPISTNVDAKKKTEVLVKLSGPALDDYYISEDESGTTSSGGEVEEEEEETVEDESGSEDEVEEEEEETVEDESGSEDEVEEEEEETFVGLEEWLHAKREVLEWATDLNSDISCRGKTEMMQDRMLDCQDEIVSFRKGALD